MTYTEREQLIIDFYEEEISKLRDQLDEAKLLLALNKNYLKYPKVEKSPNPYKFKAGDRVKDKDGLLGTVKGYSSFGFNNWNVIFDYQASTHQSPCRVYGEDLIKVDE